MSRIIPLLAICLGAAVCDARPVTPTDTGGRPLVCAGLADIACPNDQICVIPDESVDRSGTCVNYDQICRDVMCPKTPCGEGTHYMPAPGRCCGLCVSNNPQPSDSSCSVPQQCIGRGLPRSSCVGEWRCEWSRCVYRCTSSGPTQPAGD